MNAAKEMGQQLQQWREAAKLTQADVAKVLGYTSPQFISNQERGLTTPPDKTLPVLCRLYKVPHQQMMALAIKPRMEELKKVLKGSARR